jgi:hypothetical protein
LADFETGRGSAEIDTVGAETPRMQIAATADLKNALSFMPPLPPLF